MKRLFVACLCLALAACAADNSPLVVQQTEYFSLSGHRDSVGAVASLPLDRWAKQVAAQASGPVKPALIRVVEFSDLPKYCGHPDADGCNIAGIIFVAADSPYRVYIHELAHNYTGDEWEARAIQCAVWRDLSCLP